MRRREFITLFGGATVGWSIAARAQQSAMMPVIGLLGSETPELFASRWRAFGQGLSGMGYTEGKNYVVEYRWAQGRAEQLPQLAADLVSQPVSIIVAPGEAAALAAKAATSTIPIVFRIAADPLQLGLVVSLNRPGANITGATGLNIEIGTKRVEVLHELVPSATSIALLVNPENPSVAEPNVRDVEHAVQTLGLKMHVLHARAESEFDSAFSKLSAVGAHALVIGNDILFSTRCKQLAALSDRYSMPTISAYRACALAGDLVSYGVDILDQYRLAGVYVGRILKGERPADLPVQRATEFQLIINAKRARTLGLAVPEKLLALADEVIE
jgi:putative tryptophan/tyrosine transport system substrate-binding protein